MPSLSRALRRDRTRGAAAVEAAIVLPVVILVMFGIIEFGLLFKDWLAVSSGVRAAARTASAEPLASANRKFAVDAANQVSLSMAAVRVSGSPKLYVYDPGDGSIQPTASACGTTRCITFTWSGTAFTNPSGTWNLCGIGADPRDKLAVAVLLDHPSISGIGFTSITIKERALMAFEPTSTTALCS